MNTVSATHRTYQITTDRGTVSTHEACAYGDALDAQAIAAGCLSHIAWCEEFGVGTEDWTTDRVTFARSGVALLVEAVPTVLTEEQKGLLTRAAREAADAGMDLHTVADRVGLETVMVDWTATRAKWANALLAAAIAYGRPYTMILEAFALEDPVAS